MSIQNRPSSRTREKSCSCLKSATKHSKPKSNPKANADARRASHAALTQEAYQSDEGRDRSLRVESV